MPSKELIKEFKVTTDFILASLGAGSSFGVGFETREVLFLMALFCLGQFPL